MKYCPKCRTEHEDWVKLCADCEVALINQLPRETAKNNQGEKFITVYKSMFLPPVEIVRSALESENILCNMKGYDSPHRISVSIIELQVPEKDKIKSEKIINGLKIK
ncbi:MAG: hypothetical protein NTY34_05285 [Candidatus Omnitrophica bacterium]|nr:hypothetical protein [Candidatus Omnitrophota bacterium]